MDLVIKNYNIHGSSQALSPNKTSIFGSPLHSSHTSFPIIAIAIIGILATAFLLVSYYIFVIKCCLNWHRIDLLRRFSFSRNRHHEVLPLIIHSPAIENRGLDESVIRSIPIFQFKRGEEKEYECAVCLNEFQEEENLRIIPNCGHVFHIDCIDVWLQSNANCPLCRTSISATTSSFPVDQHLATPTSSSTQLDQDSIVVGNDEEFVVIELGEPNNEFESSLRVQEISRSGELWAPAISPSTRKFKQDTVEKKVIETVAPHAEIRLRTSNPPNTPQWQEPRALDLSFIVEKKVKRFNYVPSVGDECIDIRHRNNQFCTQPMRRSFSMDSAADPQLFLAVQEIVQQKRHVVSEVSSIEGCSSRVRRSFFSFGHGRSRSAILPIHLNP